MKLYLFLFITPKNTFTEVFIDKYYINKAFE